VEIKITDHTGYFTKLRDTLLKKTQPPPTNEEVLAAEEKRLGVKLEIRKEKSDG
jgi:hypothetical protein